MLDSPRQQRHAKIKSVESSPGGFYEHRLDDPRESGDAALENCDEPSNVFGRSDDEARERLCLLHVRYGACAVAGAHTDVVQTIDHARAAFQFLSEMCHFGILYMEHYDAAHDYDVVYENITCHIVRT